MQLSAPIYRLKREAKRRAREAGLPLHAALDQMARQEGFRGWSHLTAAMAKDSPAVALLADLQPGEMILLGARPGQGKTLMGLEMAAGAARLGRRGMVFTLDYHTRDVAEAMAAIGLDRQAGDVALDTSDDICARHIIERLDGLAQPALVVVDYLQLLDQKRSHPPLEDQIAELRAFTRAKGHICVVISQIDRGFDLSGRDMPGLSDVRLPNPLDLSLFDRAVFLHEGTVQVARAA